MKKHCECGCCWKNNDFYECFGCKRIVGYCLGQDDRYYEYCNYCYVQIINPNVHTVIQLRPGLTVKQSKENNND